MCCHYFYLWVGVDDSRNYIIVHMPGKTSQSFNTCHSLFLCLCCVSNDVRTETTSVKRRVLLDIIHSSHLVRKHGTGNTITNSKNRRNRSLELLIHLHRWPQGYTMFGGGFTSLSSSSSSSTSSPA